MHKKYQNRDYHDNRGFIITQQKIPEVRLTRKNPESFCEDAVLMTSMAGRSSFMMSMLRET